MSINALNSSVVNPRGGCSMLSSFLGEEVIKPALEKQLTIEDSLTSYQATLRICIESSKVIDLAKLLTVTLLLESMHVTILETIFLL